MYKRLYVEHLHLQRAFCLLHQLATPPQPVVRWVVEKRRLESTVLYLQTEMDRLQRELQLAKDDRDLLEFCALELEHQDQVHDCVDRAVNTDVKQTAGMDGNEADVLTGQSSEGQRSLERMLHEKEALLLDLQEMLSRHEAVNAELKMQCVQLQRVCNELVQKVAAASAEGPGHRRTTPEESDSLCTVTSEDEGLGEESRRSLTEDWQMRGLVQENCSLRRAKCWAEQQLETLKTEAEDEKKRLTEQVLELEEAENDARSQFQQLQEKFLFLQQKDRHFQKELADMKMDLGLTTAQLHGQLATVSQLQTLVQKYEADLRTLSLRRQFTFSPAASEEEEQRTTNSYTQTEPLDVDRARSDWLPLPTSNSQIKRDTAQRLQTLETDDVQFDESLWQTIEVGRGSPSDLTPPGCGLGESSDKELEKRQLNEDFEREIKAREKLHEAKEWLEKEAAIKTSIETMEDEKSTLVRKVSELEAEKSKLETELKRFHVQLEHLQSKHQRQLEDLRQKQDDLESRLRALEAKEQTCLQLEGSDPVFAELVSVKKSHEILKAELEEERRRVVQMKQDFQLQMDVLKDCQLREECELQRGIQATDLRGAQCDSNLTSLKEKREELEAELHNKKVELRMMEEKFQARMKALEEERHLVEADLTKKLIKMEEKAAMTTAALEQERTQLERELQAHVQDLQGRERQYQDKIAQLEGQVDHLRAELDRFVSGDTNVAFSFFERERLLQRLEDGQKKEGKMRDRLRDMERKEAAYRETLEHADKLMSSLERQYKEQIEDLELSEHTLKQRLAQLEENETHLKRALQLERRSSDGRSPSELMAELTERERRENILKEELQAAQRESLVKSKEVEKAEKRLQEQAQERGDLARATVSLQQEADSMKKELTKLRRSEAALRVALQQTDQLLAHKDDQLRREAALMQGDRTLLEETVQQLRRQVRDLEGEVRCCQGPEERHEEQSPEPSAHSDGPASLLDELIGESLERWEVQATSPAVKDHVLIIGDLERIRAELGHEVTRLQQSLVTCQSHLADLDTTCQKQAETIVQMKKQKVAMLLEAEKTLALQANVEQLLAEKDTLEKKLEDVEKEASWWRDTANRLQSQLQAPRSTVATQTDQLQTAAKQEEKRTDSRITPEDVSAGMDARLQLEECMIRAMVAMQLELQQKAIQEEVVSQHTASRQIKNSTTVDSTDESSLSDWSGILQDFQNLASPVDVPLAQQEQELISGPPPTPCNFRVLQEVGNTTLLVEWDYPEGRENIEGFEIFVEGHLQETVTADRKKALISGLDLEKPVTVAICAVSSAGLPSDMEMIWYSSGETTDSPPRVVSR